MKKMLDTKTYEIFRETCEKSLQYTYQEIVQLRQDLKKLLEEQVSIIQKSIGEAQDLKNTEIDGGKTLGEALEIRLRRQEEQFRELIGRVG